MKALSTRSPWNAARVTEYLETYIAPMRVAAQTPSGFPILCSLWFVYEDGRIYCATKRDSAIAGHLQNDPRCAFELAPNEPPYFGVRGRGTVEIGEAGAGALLERLIRRYLGPESSDFERWLMRGAKDEVFLAIEPEWLTSWDYSERMGGDSTRA